MSKNKDIRWKQRFQNYSKAFALLRIVIEENEDILTLSDLEKEGLIRRFKFTFELAWRTLKDKMQEDGIIIDKISPKFILKLAYNSKYINNIEVWIAMVNDRNLISQTYNFDNFNKVLKALQDTYYSHLEELYIDFMTQDLNE
ncbi:HI0074 family nucleotidyltransferase substrate-binding subunit [Bathymodiolus thermophilus thioautotrophic gill symbiont]|uniref:Nucleotidyltransferase n=1 Tax=Bathymodiolus thermophilus thioautotrophic gill symbiont TaxID=2360 RepID=A0A1J5TSW5_9GAMM|nr:HI0074 family nucleotidyltransferase substrate-binding subunit [Bathymodiolus thermophilus thioautotrophic gill symbiont]OIR23971.1 nucleotidyltransferase [Bathymodiolus thermophilus thioautotrophic gill symbiont]